MRSDASEVEVGDYIEMVRGFDRDDVRSFGELIGDANPIHDEIVQGHLCSSLFRNARNKISRMYLHVTGYQVQTCITYR